MSEDAVVELERLGRELRALARRALNVATVWPQVGSYIARKNRLAFATRGASTGMPWVPLAASTLKHKRRRTWLVESGSMKGEFTGRPMAIERYEPRSATFGASSRLAQWQEFGTSRHGRPHIPPRAIMVITPEDRSHIAKMILDHVEGD